MMSSRIKDREKRKR